LFSRGCVPEDVFQNPVSFKIDEYKNMWIRGPGAHTQISRIMPPGSLLDSLPDQSFPDHF